MAKMTMVEEIHIPARHGRAFEVKQGQILRLTQKAGSQVIDFNAWNRHNPHEMLWAGRTRIIEGAHPTTGNRLWSVEPWMRPMFTIIRRYGGSQADGARRLQPRPLVSALQSRLSHADVPSR